jgi:ribonuclease HI
VDQQIQNKGESQYGIYFNNQHHLNTKQRVVGEQGSDVAEIQALLHTLEICTNMKEIHIITNNTHIKSITDNILQNKQTVNGPTISRIEREIKKRVEHGKTTTISHFYSHIKEKSNPHKNKKAKEWIKKIKMKKSK